MMMMMMKAAILLRNQLFSRVQQSKVNKQGNKSFETSAVTRTTTDRRTLQHATFCDGFPFLFCIPVRKVYLCLIFEEEEMNNL